jgi:hypothetical protein
VLQFHKERKEVAMNAIIDLQSEILVDRSQVRDPHLRLLLAALGCELARDSAWVVVSEEKASHYELAHLLMANQRNAAPA